MANLRDIAELQAEIEALPFRGINKERLLETLESLADVQAVLYINNLAVPYTLSGAFAIFDQWQTSRDTKGVQEQPTPGTPPFDGLLLKANAGGTWNSMLHMTCVADASVTIQARLAIVDADGLTVFSEPFRDSCDATAGVEFALGFHGMSKNVLPQQKLIVQMRAQGNPGTGIIVSNAQFWTKRG